jgi:arabinogalactan endo-1,4-beta-galactosidase
MPTSPFAESVAAFALLASLGATPVSARPFAVGADISWLLEDEAGGATYWDQSVNKGLIPILKENGFNFIRLRIFVEPAKGYARGRAEAWCDLEHTKIFAKRIKAAGMGFLLDFHMSDTWASIGEQHAPSSWAGRSDEEVRALAYAHVHSSLQALIAQGTRPDWVQVGNEINSCMSGVCTGDWPRFAALVNAGVKGVRDADPSIKVVMQHGRPRADGNFQAWVDGLLRNKVDFDIIGGSTYGTTNNGQDWREQFAQTVAKTGKPVVSLEYTAQRTELVNDVMYDLPDQMGLGSFLWEPTRYSDYPIFDRSGNRYTTNSRIQAYPRIVREYQATSPVGLRFRIAPRRETGSPPGRVLVARGGSMSFRMEPSGGAWWVGADGRRLHPLRAGLPELPALHALP